MKVALHRSITFWSGILVMTLLCWTWWDSMSMTSTWRLGRHGAQTEVGLSGSSLYYGTMRMLPPDPALHHAVYGLPQTGPAGIVRRTARSSPNDRWFPALRHETSLIGPDNRIDHRALMIPLWLVLAAFVPLWLGLLFWRVHRRKRISSELAGA